MPPLPSNATTVDADKSSNKAGSVANQSQIRPLIAWGFSPTIRPKELKRQDIVYSTLFLDYLNQGVS